ncbi:hypothetical protein TPHA_0F00330 [Tetrapisispora phaffii CBS 4417]|uniref:Major facilitator superfamily (MFS) profile domain-containing protein n=1 Tax=Tetrapisispora phaffii (strain ATCC 24235 / CBS 4417 / NBRC 1672 / NRRL Y-8282 / UCD 70-5) TaxID=1071381 RepID=G8BUT8_TETPH|nr:hypothetical protein TPHA_0F00330 [Tetrapisispora phaffii CBS 4417]CCE63520.1 hypothetical protein TPHA_0F00330 [Tetrapisispora phaffii CBS 4417]
MATSSVSTDKEGIDTVFTGSSSSRSVVEDIQAFDMENGAAVKEGEDGNAGFPDIALTRKDSIASAAQSKVGSNRQLSRILTGSNPVGVDDEDNDISEPDYTDVPAMGGDRPYPPPLPKQDLFEVTFDGPDDPIHPFNWPLRKKVILCVILCLDCIAISMGSSIFGNGIAQLREEYGIATVVGILGVTLYVLGFAASPVIYAPLSEIYGRKGVIIISAFGFSIFQFAVATAENLQTIFICRFFGGLIGAAPMAVVPAAFADMFDNNMRGKAISLFSLGVFVGPVLGPVIGSYIVQHTTWRWLEYVIGCFSALIFVLICIFMEETHHPTILVNKAIMMRKKTNNWGIHAAHETVELSIRDIVQNTITRPIIMLATEPVLLIITIYNSFVYGILYLMLEAYPIVFVEGYGFLVNGELPYIALIVGILICTVFLWKFEEYYLKKCREAGGLVPEIRLYPIIYSGVVFAIGILWFCWTGYYPKKIHFMVPTVAGAFIGFGLFGIFLPCLNYIIESYLFVAASAVAANTFLRSGFGAVFPLFTNYMFHGMGVGWAGLLLGLFAFAMVPVPIFLVKYGKRIRVKSKYAYSG